MDLRVPRPWCGGPVVVVRTFSCLAWVLLQTACPPRFRERRFGSGEWCLLLPVPGSSGEREVRRTGLNGLDCLLLPVPGSGLADFLLLECSSLIHSQAASVCVACARSDPCSSEGSSGTCGLCNTPYPSKLWGAV